MKKEIAFATWSGSRGGSGLTADDALVERHLPAGWSLMPVPWDERFLDWRDLHAVVLRSTWDYHRRRDEFEEWLEGLAQAKVPLWNPISRLKWNLEKTYLGELSKRGVATVPTVWLEAGSAVDLVELLGDRGWKDAVIKPTVGASSHGLFVASQGNAASRQPDLDGLLQSGDAMVQQLLAEVKLAGEWSLVFLGGSYSHTVLKRAAPGEIRVQSDFGGSVVATEPPPDFVLWAEDLVRVYAGDCLYARVDAVETRSGPILMELELIEPQLFLASSPGAAERFASAIVDAVG